MPSPSRPFPAPASSACAGPPASLPRHPSDPGGRVTAYPRPSAATPSSSARSPTCSKWRALDRGSLRRRRPHQPRHHARRLRPRQRHRAHRRQLGGAQIRPQVDFLRQGAPHLPRALLAALLPAAVGAARAFPLDAAVNQGVVGAARLLQEAVGAEIDGEIGPQTFGAFAARPSRNARRLRRGSPPALPLAPIFWRFGRGWLARVDRTLAAATSDHSTQPVPLPLAGRG